MAATVASDATDGPVLSLINKRLRALRKKYSRIIQMEDAVAQGKSLNKEQEDVLRSKPSLSASIDELEKLRQPLAAALAEEIDLAFQRNQVSTSPSLPSTDTDDKRKDDNAVVEDLLNLLYFGSMFDVRNRNDFTSIMLTRTHERGCCLTYDYVTDDATDLLSERDLDLISQFGSLLMSRPVDSSLSHKHTLQQCIEHARQWLAHSDHPIDSDPNVTYAGLRAKLNKIMASDYFTITPEMKATVEMAAAAAGNYGSFQVPHDSMVPVVVSVQEEGSDEQYMDENGTNFQGDETYDNPSSPAEESHKGEFESETYAEVPSRTELDESHEEEQNHRDVEINEKHFVPRRNYQNQRGGGARRGYSNGRGGRGGRGSGPYQNGRNQYYEQPGNYYQRNYYNNWDRGGRSGGGNYYNSHSSRAQAGNFAADA